MPVKHLSIFSLFRIHITKNKQIKLNYNYNFLFIPWHLNMYIYNRAFLNTTKTKMSKGIRMALVMNLLSLLFSGVLVHSGQSTVPLKSFKVSYKTKTLRHMYVWCVNIIFLISCNEINIFFHLQIGENVTYDCIDIHLQPGLDHPLLKYHRIQVHDFKIGPT